MKQPSSEASENSCQGWTRYTCVLSSFEEVKQISSSQNKEQCPRDGVGGTRQREVCCWRAPGNGAESAARRWEFGVETE